MGREIEIKLPLSDEQYDFVRGVITGSLGADGAGGADGSVGALASQGAVTASLPGLQICSDCERLLKSDEYYSRYNTHEERRSAGEPQVIRIRGELKAVLDGAVDLEKSSEARFYFCIKRKSIENGIEFNREDETFVENADVIRDILTLSGYHKFFEKKKDALSVYCRSSVLEGASFHLELEIVNTLKYLEIEVTDEALPADQVRAGLEKFVALFGLDAKNRDSRSWMDILL